MHFFILSTRDKSFRGAVADRDLSLAQLLQYFYRNNLERRRIIAANRKSAVPKIKKIALVFSSKAGMSSSLARMKTGPTGGIDAQAFPDLFAECDSEDTISAVQKALEERYKVIPIESDENSFYMLKKAKPDLVFNISERIFGSSRESHIPCLCEMLDLPYTGSDPLTLGICLDKSRAKEILSYHGIPNPDFFVVESTSEIPKDIVFPVIVKPLFEGSSKGITNNSVVGNKHDLLCRIQDISLRYHQAAIVERFLRGREFTVGIIGNYPNLEILPIVEIDHSKLPEGAHSIYSYEAKWIWDQPHDPLKIFKCPAEISEDLTCRINTLIKRVCRILCIKDWCRIDIRLDDSGCPNVLEINPLPGILPNPEDNSCLPKAGRAAGYTYSELIHRVVDEALARYGLLEQPNLAWT
jgi:D-alanine-D-alanine ligase